MRRARRTDSATVVAGGLFVAAVLVGLMFFGGFWTVGKTYSVSVFVPNARGLAGNAHVTIAGLDVGRVTSIARSGPDAILDLRLDSGPTPLPIDSRVAVRLRSLAGESYVELYPGRARETVPSGGSLQVAQANDYVDVDQILQQLSGRTQNRARQLVQGLGAAVGDRGPQLNQVLGNAASLISDSAPVTATLAAQHSQVADLVQNLGNVMSAIGQRTTALEQFAAGARQTFASIAARDAALHQTLDQLPDTLGAVRRISLTIATVTPHIAPVATNLATALQELAPAVRLLNPASRSGIALLQALGAASDPLRGVLAHLVKLQPSASAALPAVHATLCQVDPILRYAAPYGPEAGAFFENFGSAGNPYDPSGHAARTYPLVTPALTGGVLTPQLAADEKFLESIGLFHGASESGYDPYPRPGQVNRSTAGRGAYGPATAGTTIKYPHVEADCAK